MKKIVVLLLVAGLLNACQKTNGCKEVAVVSKNGTPCQVWGIKAGNNLYPADTIPVEFQQEGLTICIEYELYEDASLCACCGGTRARIISLSQLPD